LFLLLPHLGVSLAVASIVFLLPRDAGRQEETSPSIPSEVLTVAQERFSRADNDHLTVRQQEVKAEGGASGDPS
jgi:hypothetical protein